MHDFENLNGGGLTATGWPRRIPETVPVFLGLDGRNGDISGKQNLVAGVPQLPNIKYLHVLPVVVVLIVLGSIPVGRTIPPNSVFTELMR